MESNVRLDAAYTSSEDVVAREIEDELIIVPLVAGIGDMEDEIFTVNETGRAIWDRLDGKKSLRNVAAELSAEFGASSGEIAEDVMGFVRELLKRGIVVEVPNV